ncbi:MAG: PhnA domain-containing protein [Flavobacteriales bacterium]
MSSLQSTLAARSNDCCELCAASTSLTVYSIPPNSDETPDDSIYICETCHAQLNKQVPLDENHWNCLLTSMWSEHVPVKVAAWRLLQRMRNETWAADALDMLYLDDEQLTWARSTGDHEMDSAVEFHVDSNGQRLSDGDTIVLVKTLDVKGTSFSARAGTVVKNIRLVADNVEQVEGKIENQQIVILTKYTRKG